MAESIVEAQANAIVEETLNSSFDGLLRSYEGRLVSIWVDTEYTWVGKLYNLGTDYVVLHQNFGSCPDQVKRAKPIYIRTSAIKAFHEGR